MKHYLGICLILLTLGAVVLFAMHRCESAVARSAAAISRTFLDAFQVQPQIRVNQTILMTQTAPIAELAIVSREQLVSYSLSEKMRFLAHDVPLTGKSLTAQATYRVKAGYNLQEPFRVQIDPASGRLTAQLPPARVLSVERIGQLTLRGHDGLLNPISPQEREKVLNELDAVARQSAQDSGILHDAQKQARARLEHLARRSGQLLFFDEAHSSQ